MSELSSLQESEGRSHRPEDPSFHQHNSDPYRAVRKYTGQDAELPPMPESDSMHYRTGSDSSTRRLATARSPMGVNDSNDLYDYDDFHDDPYALPARLTAGKRQHHRKKGVQQTRANSYLPYSNHARDPNTQPASLYVDDDLPSVQGGNGPVMSMLQDDIAMNNVDHSGRPSTFSVRKAMPHLDPLPEIKRRNRRRYCCNMQPRYIVFIAFIVIALVTLVWFFVWPRWPTFYYHSVSIQDGTTVECTNASMEAWWDVTMRVDNNANWVPTRIKSFTVALSNTDTGVIFANGQAGSMVLPPRQSQIMVTIPMYLAYSSITSQDPTWQSIGSCCVTKRDVGPEVQENLNVEFSIKQSISGIAWQTTSTVRPSTFGCPPV